MLGGQNGIVIAFIFAAVMNLGSYWFSDKIVLRMYRAQQVGPEHPLYRMTERLAQRGGLPMPKVYIIPDPSPNAFATGRNPNHAAVAATQGIMQVLSEHELEGVIAHELAHVKHRDILISSVAATIAAAIMMVARMAMYAGMFGGGRRRSRGRQQPDRVDRDDLPGAARGRIDPGGNFEVARIRGGRRRRKHRGNAVRACRRASQDRRGVQARAHGRQPGDRAYVHREAVLGSGADVAFQHASADRGEDSGAARRATVTAEGSPVTTVCGREPRWATQPRGGAGHTRVILRPVSPSFSDRLPGVAQRAATLALYLLFPQVWLADNSRAVFAGTVSDVKPDTTIGE